MLIIVADYLDSGEIRKVNNASLRGMSYMSTVKNFGLGGVASVIQLGKNGVQLGSIYEPLGLKTILAVADDHDNLTNIRAATPEHNDDVVTKEWCLGTNIPLGFAEDGLIVVATDTISSAIAKLDATFGKTQVLLSAPVSKPGDVWREYVSDTETVLKFHGYDGIIRAKTESWN